MLSLALTEAATDLASNPWLQWGALGLLAAVLAWLARYIPKQSEDASTRYTQLCTDTRANNKEQRESFLAELKQGRTDFLAELGREREACDERHREHREMYIAEMDRERKACDGRHAMLAQEINALRIRADKTSPA